MFFSFLYLQHVRRNPIGHCILVNTFYVINIKSLNNCGVVTSDINRTHVRAKFVCIFVYRKAISIFITCKNTHAYKFLDTTCWRMC